MNLSNLDLLFNYIILTLLKTLTKFSKFYFFLMMIIINFIIFVVFFQTYKIKHNMHNFDGFYGSKIHIEIARESTEYRESRKATDCYVFPTNLLMTTVLNVAINFISTCTQHKSLSNRFLIHIVTQTHTYTDSRHMLNEFYSKPSLSTIVKPEKL